MKDSKDQSIGMNINANNLKIFPLDASFQSVNRLFVLAFDNIDIGNNKVEERQS